MQIDESTLKFARQIIATFDPKQIKKAALDQLQDTKQATLDKVAGDRWDRIVKLDEIEDQKEELEAKEFSKEQQEYMSKVIGCSKDHGKEIDLWNKSFSEKVERIKTMLGEADKAGSDTEEGLQKQAYYNAQALLIFYYLIAEGEEQEIEVKQLQALSHRRQAQTFLGLKRFDEAIGQLNLLRQQTKIATDGEEIEVEVLFLTWRYEECRTLLQASLNQSLKDRWIGKVDKAVADHLLQEKKLYKKMLANSKQETGDNCEGGETEVARDTHTSKCISQVSSQFDDRFSNRYQQEEFLLHKGLHPSSIASLDICSEHQCDTEIPANHFEPENPPNVLESRLVKIEQDLQDLKMQFEMVKMYGGVPEPRKVVVQQSSNPGEKMQFVFLTVLLSFLSAVLALQMAK